MRLSEIKENWTFIRNIGATSYWLEKADNGTGCTIGPKEVLEIGCQLEVEKDTLRNGISFIIADSLGNDTSVDWIRIQLNRLLKRE